MLSYCYPRFLGLGFCSRKTRRWRSGQVTLPSGRCSSASSDTDTGFQQGEFSRGKAGLQGYSRPEPFMKRCVRNTPTPSSVTPAIIET